MPTIRKDGRLQTSVSVDNPLTGKSKKVYVYGYSMEELEAEIAKVRSMSTADFIKPKTFQEYANEFIRLKVSQSRADSTIESYRIFLEKHLLPNLPDGILLDKVSPALIKAALVNIKTDRNKVGAYLLLKQIYKEACFDQLMDKNPLDMVRKPEYKAKVKDLVTPELYHELLDRVAGSVYYYIFIFVMDTGLRRGEICALKWADVDLEKKTVSVRMAQKWTKGGHKEGDPKSRYSVRKIVLTDSAVRNLIEWQAFQKRLYKDKPQPGYLFTTPLSRSKNGEMAGNSITNKFSRLKKAMGLDKNVSFHSFRHTHTTLLAEMELNAKKIQLRLGHSSAAFTMDRYTHNTTAMQEGVADALDEALKKYNNDETSE